MSEAREGENLVQAAAAALRAELGDPPNVLLVLGSGLGPMADSVEDPVEVPFEALPGFPAAGVEGHAGKYLAGSLDGRSVLVQAGRLHAYEGYPMDLVVRPMRIAAALGIGVAILTNAAGGINRQLGPGSLMLLDDHINLMSRNPLVGPVQPGEERFPDMSAPYDPQLLDHAVQAALAEGIPLVRGTYAAMLGPSYETPAEVRMLDRMGVDAVGMSTVPEAITARASGMRVVAFSLVTNRAAGLSDEPLSHDDVVEIGRKAGGALERILRRVLQALP